MPHLNLGKLPHGRCRRLRLLIVRIHRLVYTIVQIVGHGKVVSIVQLQRLMSLGMVQVWCRHVTSISMGFPAFRFGIDRQRSLRIWGLSFYLSKARDS